ncbi:MAG: SsrA-binding protein SmpB [Dehalococcoidia bacterium]|nr:SsrA-binding protein SmpB [Dehalococcoidia bacterium]
MLYWKMIIKVISTNRKAHFNYSILETFEAGIVLLGSEIKSVRENRVSLSEAYVKAEHGEMWLVGAHIARYEAASYMTHEPTRPRKLLMRRKEIRLLLAKLAEKGLTATPMRMYLKGHRAKLEIGLGRGKKLYDKRETITRRENDRELERTLKMH